MMLNAGLDGVKNKLKAPFSVDEDIFEMTAEQMEERGITVLPGSLKEALDELEANPLAKETLGEHIFTKYIEGKQKEWDDYRCSVTEWELDNYLSIY
jgi:glutamine synthetase